MSPAQGNGSGGDEAPRDGGAPALVARRHHRRFGFVWLIPIVAVLVAGYLGWRTFSDRGPLVEVTFQSADGLTAGQTPVRYKAVQVGTVERVSLEGDLKRVRIAIRMTNAVSDRLTEGAKFWVVRPRLTAGNISGLETIVSGAYIEFDPGPAEGNDLGAFTGLENPPGVRSDEPGRVFTLHARRIGSLNRGSPVFFRDVNVGEILSYDPPALDGQITLHAFVRAPYDGYLREGSRFWNTSGVQVKLGAEGIKLELESARALLSGGIAFDTPPSMRDQPRAPDSAEYTLYDDLNDAISATSPERLTFLVYFEGSVRGLAPGAPVTMRGIRIGSVQDVHLEFDKNSAKFRVPVHIAIEPDRISFPAGRPATEVRAFVDEAVRQGLRAQLSSASLLTGQMLVALDFLPDAEPAQVRMEGDEIVLPSVGGGTDNIMAAASEVAGKLQRFPIEEIGRNLNNALASVNGLVGGPDVRNAVRALSSALASVQELTRNANAGLGPLMRRLPGIADNLDQAVKRANAAVGSIEQGYGKDSEVNREMSRLLDQATDTARSVRLLSDYLSRHPEALVRGRVNGGSER
ncbi:PqiB family protein [Roseomonas elaeocarpi]|uniref:Intermembrane transport protein PqiB n=1 Tax=Roseomonas elaeocarpi TaxID=907779 RepID=A0ABV6JU42_9PROT